MDLDTAFNEALKWVRLCISTAWGLADSAINDNTYPEELTSGVAYIVPQGITFATETPLSDEVTMEFTVAYKQNIDTTLGRTRQKAKYASQFRHEVLSDNHPGTSDVLYSPMVTACDVSDVSQDNTVSMSVNISVTASVVR